MDLKTGARKWYFQLVHHPIWDFDISSAPLLVDATIEGNRASWWPFRRSNPTCMFSTASLVSRSGQCRKPRFRKATSRVRRPRRRNRFPTKAAALSRPFLGTNDIIDFTPELHQQALENLKLYRWLQTSFVPATMTDGEWKGAVNMGPAFGRSQLARIVVRSGDRDLLRPGEQFLGRDDGIRPGLCGGRESSGASRASRAELGIDRRKARQWPRRPHHQRPTGTADREAALRRADRDRSQYRRPEVSGTARRHAGQRPQQSGAQGAEHSQDRADRAAWA